MNTNLKKELKRQVKEFNNVQANIQKQLKEMYEQSKKHLEEDKARFYSRGYQPIDYAAVLGR